MKRDADIARKADGRGSCFCGYCCDFKNGGYPLDQNIYQTVKGLTAEKAASVKAEF